MGGWVGVRELELNEVDFWTVSSSCYHAVFFYICFNSDESCILAADKQENDCHTQSQDSSAIFRNHIAIYRSEVQRSQCKGIIVKLTCV